MAKKQPDEKKPRDANRSAVPNLNEPELPPPGPGPSGPGSVDLTGQMPDNIKVDPDITEGHPGYQQSGGSEILPPKRLVEEEDENA